MPSHLEEDFNYLLQKHHFPPCVREHRFHPVRRWRIDFAWPELLIGVEVEGGLYIKGGHNTGKGYEKDLEKYAEALILGWRILRIGRKMIRDGSCVTYLDALFKFCAK